MRYFPISLDLQGRRCLVIGQGRLADEKEASLRRTGASVSRIAAFEAAAAREAYLIIAICETQEEGVTIRRFAEEHRILLNVVD